ncbi:hypothetical protein AKJ09_01593 [Labilithrix luteola]|uniref:Type IV fimbrial biogenesis protein PilY1 n=1 Tax=Labilithrix luteola TaxID=1391654 RepID=A0A0K1PP82_9BACT|nr:hypothetical protein [Labilithrix luteola]AKU94929.1 hypothetical protein AKJ09_01593 [Labilithrix luteola]
MRATLLVCCGSLALGATVSVVACATAATEPSTTPAPQPDSGEVALEPTDGGQNEAAADSDADAAPVAVGPTCSDAGWCTTSLPDDGLVLKDVWAIGSRAFAIAYSKVLGAKVLEWVAAESSWKYIDDGTQNEALPRYVGRIWAPNENEIYYGVDPGYIYHGTRSTSPATTWSWARQALKDNSHADYVDPKDGYPYYNALDPNYAGSGVNYPTLGVWGTSADDVYAWFTNTVYHLTKVGGAAQWVPEYTADDPSAANEHMYFLAAAGTGPDDVWFSGTRTRSPSSASCALLVRKTAGSYQRIADGVLTSDWAYCAASAGYLLIGGTQGWLTDIHTPSADRVIGLKGARDIINVSVTDSGYSATVTSAPNKIANSSVRFNSLWAASGSIWLSGLGIILRTPDDVLDGGAFQISTVAMAGEPLSRQIYQVRGTSDSNIWAIGDRNALHKTTP